LRPDELRVIGAWLKQQSARTKVPASVRTLFVSGQSKAMHRASVNLLLEKYGL
jgi:hypothetical protein